MKSSLKMLALIPLLFVANIANAQTKLTAKSASVVIHGNSTMHEWSSNVTKVSVTGDFDFSNGIIEKVNHATVKMESKSIKSTKDSDLMDDRTHSTLKAAKFPTITYECTNTVSSENGTIKVNGNLTLAGVTKPIDLTMKVTTLANGDIELKGSRKILMSNFGIKPPSFMLGTLNVDDAVTIAFDVVLKK